MDAVEMRQYICDTYEGVVAVDSSGDTFFSYDPNGDLPDDRWQSFATIVTGDHYDRVSDLDARGAFRLNMGLTKATYTAAFGVAPQHRDADGVLETGSDYTATDALMPHPFYASLHWACVINPAEATLDTVRIWLAEAHDFALRKYANQLARRESGADESDRP